MKSAGLLPHTLLAVIAVSGCSQTIIVPVDPTTIPQAPAGPYTDTDWQEVLQANVRDERVHYKNLARNRGPLLRYLGLISVVGPESTPQLFPTPSDKICYYINAYNACVLRVVLQSYPLRELQRAKSPRLQYDYELRVDGRNVRLADLQQKLEAASQGDMRVLFCLSGASLGSPALNQESYRPDDLREQLRSAAQRALANPQLIRADHQARRLLLWMPLINRRQDFLAFYQRVSSATGDGLLGLLSMLADQPTRSWLQRCQDYRQLRMPVNRRLDDVG